MGAVVDQPSSALMPTWFGISPLAGWMFSVPSVVPEKYRSFGQGKMPCAGWNNAAVTAGAGGDVEPFGLPLPAVGSVGPTTGELPTELEQPAIAIAATNTTAAAVSLFMRALLEILLLISPVLRRTWGADGLVGYAWAPKGGKTKRPGANTVKEEKSGKSRAAARAHDAGSGARPGRVASRVLRIVGGRHRGRKLRFPAGVEIRPTPDRVR